MTREQLAAWLEAYEQAWRTPGTDPLRALFAENASYRTAPYLEPYRGLDAIAAMWERERAGPDEEFELDREIVAVDGDTAVVRTEVRYGAGQGEFRNLWIVRLDGEGRCVAFEEWFFARPA